jgi:hypothetical protein
MNKNKQELFLERNITKLRASDLDRVFMKKDPETKFNPAL